VTAATAARARRARRRDTPWLSSARVETAACFSFSFSFLFLFFFSSAPEQRHI
jgi:hypothetical protein